MSTISQNIADLKALSVKKKEREIKHSIVWSDTFKSTEMVTSDDTDKQTEG